MKHFLRSLFPLGLLAAGWPLAAQAQTPSVGIGTTTPDTSALLELSSSTQGLLAPRLTAAQREAIASPAQGLLVFQTDGVQPGFWYYSGAAWQLLPDKARSGDNLGDHAATQPLALNEQPIRLRLGSDTNHQLAYSGSIDGPQLTGYAAGQLGTRSGNTYTPVLHWNNAGRVGIGTSTPNARLDLGNGGLALSAGISNSAPRPTVGSARLAGEIAGFGGAGAGSPGNDDGFLRLSAGGGTTPGARTYLDLSGYSQLADMNQNIVLGTAGTERLRVVQNGKVGIGTSTPGARLEVRGDGSDAIDLRVSGRMLSGDANNNGGLWLNQGTTQFVGQFDSNTLGFYNNGSWRLAVDNAGNVGIGTTAPQATLDIPAGTLRLPSSGGDYSWLNYSGTGYNYLRGTTVLADLGGNVGIGTNNPLTRLSITPAAIGPKITLWDNGLSTAHYGFGVSNGQLNYHVDGGAARHVFYVGGKNGDGTELMRIQGNGRVGIGTTTPTQLLEVAGNIQLSGAGSSLRFPDGSVQGTAATAAGFIQNQTTAQPGASFNVAGSGTVGGVLTANSGAKINDNNPIEFGANVVGKENNAGKIGYQTFSSGLDIVGAGTDGTNRRITFYNEGGATFNGNVGIGASSPSQKLHVAGQVYSSAGGFRFPDNSVQTTAAVTQTLSLSGQTLGISDGNTVTLPVGADNLGNHTATQNLNLGTNKLVGGGGTAGINILTNGNVGIGTTTPASTLDIPTGSVHLPGDSWIRFSGTGYNYLRGTTILADQGGNVGIGTSSPAFPLDVQATATPAAYSYAFLSSSSPNGQIGSTGSGTGPVSIRATGRVMASEFNATSDRRLKKVLGLSNSVTDLALLRRLRITDYQMRDRAQYGNQQFKKVIAQEVEEVFPQAVQRQRGFLPDVYALADAATLLPGDSLLQLTLPQTLPTAARPGQRLRLIGEKSEVLGTVALAANGCTLLVRGARALAGQRVFVFGLEHDDVRSVDYEALAILGISATQELARQLDELKQQNATLRQQNQTQDTRLNQQQASLQTQADATASLAQRLQALEAQLAPQARAAR